jgi:hypothetical protein
MGHTDVIDRHHRTPREGRPGRGARPRPWAITIAVLVILFAVLVLSFIIGIATYFLGSDWLAQHVEDIRWFVNEVKVWRLQLHP